MSSPLAYDLRLLLSYIGLYLFIFTSGDIKGQALNDLSDNLSRSGLSSKYVPVLEVPPKWNLLMVCFKCIYIILLRY